ncbi:MAG: hypothetical protein JWR16_2136, partial [Nevskia sp.]|nr:hypothetical protein [Nevskia sp.]
MQAIVKEFLVPMGFCVVCAVGGWALGRDSAPTRVASGATIGHLHAQSAGVAERHLDATGVEQLNQPRLIRSEGFKQTIVARPA